MTESDKISRAAFEAWQHANSAQVFLLMAHRFGGKDSAKIARVYLASAVATLDAMLADQPAPISVEA